MLIDSAEFLEGMLHTTELRVLTDGSSFADCREAVTSQWLCLWPPEKAANVGYKNGGGRRSQSLSHCGKWNYYFNQSSEVGLGEPR